MLMQIYFSGSLTRLKSTERKRRNILVTALVPSKLNEQTFYVRLAEKCSPAVLLLETLGERSHIEETMKLLRGLDEREVMMMFIPSLASAGKVRLQTSRILPPTICFFE